MIQGEVMRLSQARVKRRKEKKSRPAVDVSEGDDIVEGGRISPSERSKRGEEMDWGST